MASRLSSRLPERNIDYASTYRTTSTYILRSTRLASYLVLFKVGGAPAATLETRGIELRDGCTLLSLL